jgi:uncharacterized protein (TIGR03000 family)
MYSVVLMMSLSGGMEVPDFGGRRCHCSGSGYYGGCNGCSGCYGGCRGGRCHGRCGGYGGGCYGGGCCGGSSCCGGSGCCGGTAPGYRAPSGERVPAPKKVQADDRATITVNLPADATLTVGGRPTTSISAQRHFITPPLEVGREARYVFRAEIVRDGRTLSAVQQVVVSPGRETQVTFDFAPAGIASSR